jgi:predicted ester cyclase
MVDTGLLDEKIQCIERFYTACLAHDWDQAFSLVSQAVKYQHPRFKRPQRYTTARRHFEGFLQAFPDIRRDVLLRFCQGNWVCVETRWRGTNTEPFILPNGHSIPPTQNTIDAKDLGVYKIEEGMITEIRLYEDLLSLRRQLRGQHRR